ncbi:DUF1266 domain-containing protein [Brevibacillus porteri]|uniref:DUF1266 domain-containing protein n=1 Tax=Brevibacillus porteri TaxID=2126350 RepID=UPI00370CDF0E
MAPTVLTYNQKGHRLFLRALSSVCFSKSGAYYYALYHENLSRRTCLFLLKEKQITDKTALIDTIKWLISEGKREEFNRLRHFLFTFSESERTAYIQALPEDHQSKSQLILVDYYSRCLPSEGIAAHDYAWCILLSRAGLKLGYLQKDQAIEYMLSAARLAQQAYSGWSEYIAGFVAGIDFLIPDTSFQTAKENRGFYTKLLASRHSPMRQVDWNVALNSNE